MPVLPGQSLTRSAQCDDQHGEVRRADVVLRVQQLDAKLGDLTHPALGIVSSGAMVGFESREIDGAWFEARVSELRNKHFQRNSVLEVELAVCGVTRHSLIPYRITPQTANPIYRPSSQTRTRLPLPLL